MEPIITFVTENLVVVAMVGVVLVPLLIVYQKKAMPLIFHTVEYFVYLFGMHYLLWLMVQVAWWYKESTAMDAADTASTGAFTTPANVLTQNFFDRTLYAPTWLFYFELVMVFVFLYVIIVVRPTSYSGSNTYKGDKNRGMGPDADRRGQGGERYDRSRASNQRQKRT